jgi:hypothetical protein
MLTVRTTDPVQLLTRIKRAIDTKNVVTWGYDRDGDFTHEPSQWRQKAWLRPAVIPGALTFQFIWNSNSPRTGEVYGVYHGRFVEMLFAHFANEFSLASAN